MILLLDIVLHDLCIIVSFTDALTSIEYTLCGPMHMNGHYMDFSSLQKFPKFSHYEIYKSSVNTLVKLLCEFQIWTIHTTKLYFFKNSENMQILLHILITYLYGESKLKTIKLGTWYLS